MQQTITVNRIESMFVSTTDNIINVYKLQKHVKTLLDTHTVDSIITEIYFVSDTILVSIEKSGNLSIFSINEESKNLTLISENKISEDSLTDVIGYEKNNVIYLTVSSNDGKIHFLEFSNGKFLKQKSEKIFLFSCNSIDCNDDFLVASGDDGLIKVIQDGSTDLFYEKQLNDKIASKIRIARKNDLKINVFAVYAKNKIYIFYQNINDEKFDEEVIDTENEILDISWSSVGFCLSVYSTSGMTAYMPDSDAKKFKKVNLKKIV